MRNNVRNNMRSIPIKYTLLFFILVLFIFGNMVLPASSGSPDPSQGDILVHLRLYEGWRGNEQQTSTVVSTYYLKPLFVSNLVSELDINEEKKELKLIFNLADIRLMTSAQLGWKEGVPNKQFKMIVLNGHEFQVQLTMTEKNDDFKVEVLDNSRHEQKPLLETDVTLPEKKSTVFGFEDSLHKPFFLCLQREKNQSVIYEEPASPSANIILKRIKYISPKYPESALENKIQGVVLLNTTIDKEGMPVDITAVSGPNELHQAAIDAVKQWRWEPIPSLKADKLIKATMTVKFDLQKDESEKTGSMDFYFENGSLYSFLTYIAKKTNINIATDPDVDLEVLISCKMDDTQWEKALQRVLQLHELDMVYKGNVVRIFKKNAVNEILKQNIKEKKYTGHPMEFNFKNAKLRDVLNIIAKVQHLKMDIAPEVDGNVTVNMKEVPWDQFLDLALELNGLDAEVKGNVYKIFPKKQPPTNPKHINPNSIPNIYPTKGYLTSMFGTRKNPLSGENEFHSGIDIVSKPGVNVVATADGVIIQINEKTSDYGISLIIDHGYGYTTYYRELSDLTVKRGDRVKRGQALGIIGKAGRKSTGPHLHYEVRFMDKPVNPLSLIEVQ